MRNFVAQLTLLLTPNRDCGADGGARTHNLRFRSSFKRNATY
jgi:hypothetical protein